MNILMFSQYFFPERFLINDISKELVERGNKVTVVTGVPNYPSGIVEEKYKNNRIPEEMINGVRVIRCPIVPRGNSKIQLLVNYFSYMIKANKRTKKLKDQFDVVYIYQLTPILVAYPAVKFAQKENLPLVCYCLDLAPLSGIGFVNKIHPLMKLYTRFSRWAYNQCDHIAVTSKSFISYINEVHGYSLEKMSYIPQHASEELITADLKKKHDTIVKLYYAGNLGNGPKLENVIYAAKGLINRNVDNFEIDFVGSGSAKEQLIMLSNSLGTSKVVKFLDPVPMEKMPEVYKDADALIVTLKKGQITVPGKVQAYMATGKPIIASMDGSGYDLIQEVGCGICVRAEDPDGLSGIMEQYINHPELYDECGENGKRYFLDNMTLKIHVDKLEMTLHNVINQYYEDPKNEC